MKNKRRQAVIPIDEPTHLGPVVEALMGDDNAPKELGDLKHELYPTLNPFHYDENILISNREESESQGGREARLVRRLVLLRRQAGSIKIDGLSYLIRGNFTEKQVRERYQAFKAKYPSSALTFAQWAVQRGAVYFAKKRN